MAEAPRNRAKNTRGRPFQKGNSGKPKGARRRTTVLAEALMQKEAEAVTRAVIDAAKGGDMTAARIILDRVSPARRDNPVKLDLPQIENAKDACTAMASVVAAVSRGEITPGEGAEVARIIEQHRRVIETSEIEARVAALEARNQK